MQFPIHTIMRRVRLILALTVAAAGPVSCQAGTESHWFGTESHWFGTESHWEVRSTGDSAALPGAATRCADLG